MAAEITVKYTPEISKRPTVTSSKSAYEILWEFYNKDTIALNEDFYVMYLNRGHKVLGIYPHTKGGINYTIADVRLILSVGLKIASSSIMLSHNHPSGSLKPSQADIDLTKKIKQAAALMEITMLDHIIVIPEKGEYYSFAEEGDF